MGTPALFYIQPDNKTGVPRLMVSLSHPLLNISSLMALPPEGGRRELLTTQTLRRPSSPDPGPGSAPARCGLKFPERSGSRLFY